MLTTDLVAARVVKGTIRPRWVNEDDDELLALAERLIAAFAEHRGRTRDALDASLRDLAGAEPRIQLHRGLAKLLLDRCDFATVSPHPPNELRAAVFTAAADAWRGAGGEDGGLAVINRGAVLEHVALTLDAQGGETALDDGPAPDDEAARAAPGGRTAADAPGLDPAALDAALYADLDGEQVLTEFRSVDAVWLLRRYNVALAQGVLLRARELRIALADDAPRRHRALFRKIKFFRLMHRVERRPEGGWDLVLDGPMSVLRSSGRYGLAMASFLPTLLCFDDWSLEADVAWGRARSQRRFELSSTDGLCSHARLDGQWQPDELQGLPERVEALDRGWRLVVGGELIDLGGAGVLVPDFVAEHRATGARVPIEVFGFWNRGAVVRRLELLARHGPPRHVLALSASLAAGLDALEELPSLVYVFRKRPIAGKLIEVLERCRGA
ncbi:MAG: DUF790 family protein [Acidobacteriota bacterium]